MTPSIRNTLALCLLSTFACAVHAADDTVTCNAITVNEGDPIPADACAVNIVPKRNTAEGIIMGGEEGVEDAVAPADAPRDWVVLNRKTMPEVSYDRANMQQLSRSPLVLLLDLRFQHEPAIAIGDGAPYSATVETLKMNCTQGTYTLVQSAHYADIDASQFQDNGDAEAKDLPMARDSVKQQLKKLVCAIPTKKSVR
jgi:hypothetical protein